MNSDDERPQDRQPASGDADAAAPVASGPAPWERPPQAPLSAPIPTTGGHSIPPRTTGPQPLPVPPPPPPNTPPRAGSVAPRPPRPGYPGQTPPRRTPPPGYRPPGGPPPTPAPNTPTPNNAARPAATPPPPLVTRSPAERARPPVVPPRAAAPAAGPTENAVRDRLDPYYPQGDFEDSGAADRDVAGGHSGSRGTSALAYSAMDSDSDSHSDSSDPNALEEPVGPSEVATRRKPGGRRDAPANTPRRVNRMAIWALVLSIFGITALIGIILGFKARSDIPRKNEEGDPYAVAALVIGFLYVAVFLVGLCVYWWIRS